MATFCFASDQVAWWLLSTTAETSTRCEPVSPPVQIPYVLYPKRQKQKNIFKFMHAVSLHKCNKSNKFDSFIAAQSS